MNTKSIGHHAVIFAMAVSLKVSATTTSTHLVSAHMILSVPISAADYPAQVAWVAVCIPLSTILCLAAEEARADMIRWHLQGLATILSTLETSPEITVAAPDSRAVVDTAALPTLLAGSEAATLYDFSL